MNRPKLALLLWCACVLGTLPLLAAGESPRTEQLTQTRDQVLAKAVTTTLSIEEHFKLATSLLGLGHFEESTLVAKLGLGLTQNRMQKSLFYIVISQCRGARGFYNEAGEAALEGQRLDPLSKDLAALRFAYFTKHGDQAQAKAAEDTLRQLVPGLGDRPVGLGPLGPWLLEIFGQEIKVQFKILCKIAKEEGPRIQEAIEEIADRIWTKWLLAQADRFAPTK